MQKPKAEQPRSGKTLEERYLTKLGAYDGLRVIPPDVSPPNKALLVIAGICTTAITALSWSHAPWYAYACVLALSAKYSILVVWREKHAAKTKTTDST